MVPADHACLAGHFPGRPIVPAVVLLELAVEAIHERFPSLQVSAVGSAKFLRPVFPASPLTLQLSVDTSRGQARFRCQLAEGDAAVGELGFVAVPAA